MNSILLSILYYSYIKVRNLFLLLYNDYKNNHLLHLYNNCI